MRTYVLTAALLALVASPAFAAKEKANKTKCSNALRRMQSIGSSGIDGVRAIQADLLPEVVALLAAGDEEGARDLAAKAVRKIRHRGHVTVLKLHATSTGCLGQAERQEIDPDLVKQVQAARDKAIAAVEEAVERAVDSFFDIFTGVD